jgi:2-polyprenyl-6-methoxyphenol hydroxylase-like FAD-dependent oxidoreductase
MRSAVVVGAGVGGLAAAGALARTGWQVTLLERADRLRPARAAVLLWPSGVQALRALGLGAGLDAIATPVPRTGIRRPNGQWLRQPGARPAPGGTPVVVHGEDLHDAFVAGLGDRIEIRTGVTVRASRPGADRPGVTDGRTSWEADLVIGADGVASALRQRLAPQVSRVSGGCAAWRAVIPWYRAPHPPPGTPQAGDTIGGGHRFGYASLGERGASGGSSRGGIYWVAVAPGAPRPEPAETQLALLRRWLAGWHAPIGDLLAATEPADLVQDGMTELEPMPAAFAHRNGAGGYALVGNAAHAFADHLGQGASLALEDAVSLQALLLDAVPGRTLGAALDEYSRLRRGRVLRLARLSRRVGAALQPRGRVAARARELALGTLVPRALDAAAAGTADWRPPGG